MDEFAPVTLRAMILFSCEVEDRIGMTHDQLLKKMWSLSAADVGVNIRTGDFVQHERYTGGEEADRAVLS
jgi:hypothetical protein